MREDPNWTFPLQLHCDWKNFARRHGLLREVIPPVSMGLSNRGGGGGGGMEAIVSCCTPRICRFHSFPFAYVPAELFLQELHRGRLHGVMFARRAPGALPLYQVSYPQVYPHLGKSPK